MQKKRPAKFFQIMQQFLWIIFWFKPRPWEPFLTRRYIRINGVWIFCCENCHAVAIFDQKMAARLKEKLRPTLIPPKGRKDAERLIKRKECVKDEQLIRFLSNIKVHLLVFWPKIQMCKPRGYGWITNFLSLKYSLWRDGWAQDGGARDVGCFIRGSISGF